MNYNSIVLECCNFKMNFNNYYNMDFLIIRVLWVWQNYISRFLKILMEMRLILRMK